MTGFIDALAVRRVQWQAACRIVPTRHPSVYLYDRVADAADFDALYALESMTNERLRDAAGAVQLVATEDRVFGTGSGSIMAAFTRQNPLGSRFSDGRYGVFYAARERATAIAETARHHARFLAATAEAPMHLPMRVYQVAIDARLHDLRQTARRRPLCSIPRATTRRRRSAPRCTAPARPGWSIAACAAAAAIA